ncbi:MAG: threonine synthase [Candidatus Micrarchaeota archaeon]|nr:threonine synthase [Candidatus Micrarchaeota archaeon]
MHEKYMECSDCGKRFSLDKQVFRCPECGGSVEIIFDYDNLKKEISKEKFAKRDFDHLRYYEFYPIEFSFHKSGNVNLIKENMLTLGEGGTPLLRSKNIEKKFKLPFKLFFKNETVNPTGSFKDRGSAVEVAKAKELGKERAVCASTGNMGASVAAYSAVANIACDIFTPRDAPNIKIEQIMAYGANVFRIDGDYTKAEKMSEIAFEKYGAYLLGDYAYRREGTKSVGFEIIEQLDYEMGNVSIVCPVGNGLLLSAVWKAAKEFKEVGLLEKLPSMVGMQAEGCRPVVDAYDNGLDTFEPVADPKTVAGAIECGNPLDGNRALKAIKDSEGWADFVSDGEILKARKLLASEEGIFPEPAGAAALAGILKRKGFFEEGSTVVCLVTGNGLKTPHTGINTSPQELKYNDAYLKKLFERPLT